MTNIADPDQAVWSGSATIVYALLTHYNRNQTFFPINIWGSSRVFKLPPKDTANVHPTK